MTPHDGDIALNLIPGIGFARYTALLEHFGSAEAVFAASRSDLEQLPRLGRKLADTIASFVTVNPPANTFHALASS